MVADALKIREQLGVNDGGFIRARVHALQLALPHGERHVVDFLLHLSDLFKPGGGDGFQRVNEPHGLQADRLHLPDLGLGGIGKGDVLFHQQLCVFTDIHGVVADTLQIAGDLEESADARRIALVRLIDDYGGNVV